MELVHVLLFSSFFKIYFGTENSTQDLTLVWQMLVPLSCVCGHIFFLKDELKQCQLNYIKPKERYLPNHVKYQYTLIQTYQRIYNKENAEE